MSTSDNSYPHEPYKLHVPTVYNHKNYKVYAEELGEYITGGLL